MKLVSFSVERPEKEIYRPFFLDYEDSWDKTRKGLLSYLLNFVTGIFVTSYKSTNNEV